MRIQFIGILLCLLSLIACAPLADYIWETQTVHPAATFSAESSNGLKTTLTPHPTRTRLLRDVRIEELRPSLLQAVASGVADLEDVDSVTYTRFHNGALELVLRTKSAEPDDQGEVSWIVLNMFAEPLARVGQDTLEAVTGGPFNIALTVYSIDGSYRYRSVTDWETLLRVAQEAISYEEWQSFTGAGFK